MGKTLYICYFGVREPLVQTQVLPYLRELRKGGIEVSILTFEPGDIKREIGDARIADIKHSLADEGIAWHWRPYHKRISAFATAWDVFQGARFVYRFIGIEKPEVLHGRVHVPTLMGALGRRFSRHKPKLLFDIRGFFPEEYTDAGIWSDDGLLYRSAKRVERWLMKESDGFIVLTENAREILFPESNESGRDRFGRPVEVIPCCVDFEKRFSGDRVKLRAATRAQLGIEGRFVVVHAGALGGLYLTEEIANFLEVAREMDPSTYALFLTQSDPGLIEPLLQERGFNNTDYFIGRVPSTDIEKYLYASDIGVSFVRAGYATASRSPTKIPEYLACGLPIVANAGVGDVDDLIEERQTGYLLREFSRVGYVDALRQLRSFADPGQHLRQTAQEEFDLYEIGGKRYRRLYEKLLGT